MMEWVVCSQKQKSNGKHIRCSIVIAVVAVIQVVRIRTATQSNYSSAHKLKLLWHPQSVCSSCPIFPALQCVQKSLK